jgi:hypothetical protein
MPIAVIRSPAERADPQAYSIPEFAAAFRISRATLYNLWRDGRGPARMQVRGRVLISRPAAERWRAAMESGTREGAA